MRRFVAQSVAVFGRYAREGGPIKTEDDPVEPHAAGQHARSAAALNHLERVVTELGGIALRYGVFYGAANDGTIEPVRKRQFPIIGDGGGIWSWIHLDDAAAATVLALEHDGPAIYNIVDDDPAPVREWLPVLAEALGREAAAALPDLARAAAGRRGCGRDEHRGAGCLEREGQARARLDAAPSELAPGLPGGLLDTQPGRPGARRRHSRPAMTAAEVRGIGRVIRIRLTPADLADVPAVELGARRAVGEPAHRG